MIAWMFESHIETLVREAKRELLDEGSAWQLKQLIDVDLRADRIRWVSKSNHMFPSVDRDLLDDVYRVVLWQSVLGYDPERFPTLEDFVKYFRGTLKNKRADLAREEMPHVMNTQSLDYVFNFSDLNFDWVFAATAGEITFKGDTLKVKSAEDTFFEQSTIEAFNDYLDSNVSFHEYEKALVLSQIEHGLSLGDTLEFCDSRDRYKNKQALWRATKKLDLEGFDANAKLPG